MVDHLNEVVLKWDAPIFVYCLKYGFPSILMQVTNAGKNYSAQMSRAMMVTAMRRTHHYTGTTVFVWTNSSEMLKSMRTKYHRNMLMDFVLFPAKNKKSWFTSQARSASMRITTVTLMWIPNHSPFFTSKQSVWDSLLSDSDFAQKLCYFLLWSFWWIRNESKSLIHQSSCVSIFIR